jgi:hypothetical protein
MSCTLDDVDSSMAARTLDSHVWDLIAENVAISDIWGDHMAAKLRLVEKSASNVGRVVSDTGFRRVRNDVFRLRHKATAASFKMVFCRDSGPDYDDIVFDVERDRRVREVLEHIDEHAHAGTAWWSSTKHYRHIERLMFECVIDARIAANVGHFMMNDLMIA